LDVLNNFIKNLLITKSSDFHW